MKDVIEEIQIDTSIDGKEKYKQKMFEYGTSDSTPSNGSKHGEKFIITVYPPVQGDNKKVEDEIDE
ncbi:hypothetical protein [Paraclostridium dentum]|uniref:hypothetical protein n=1 Tax=Paraclostridium dentum TaxID=2662455 RepID=UPI003F328DCA